MTSESEAMQRVNDPDADPLGGPVIPSKREQLAEEQPQPRFRPAYIPLPVAGGFNEIQRRMLYREQMHGSMNAYLKTHPHPTFHGFVDWFAMNSRLVRDE